MTTFETLQQTIATTLKVAADKISPSTRDEDIPSWDSLGQVNLIMAIEQAFDVVVEVEDFGELNSVPTILAFLAKQGVA